MTNNIQNYSAALADVIQEYVNRGFGSMNKNDFEVWIFNYLLQNNLNGKSNFDISVELGIPETKVKRLRYEASLKYGNPKDINQYNAKFHALLSNVNLKKRGSDSIIQFAVEDIQLRKYLDSILKRKGRFADTSFNTEVVSITLDDLAILLDETCSQAEKDKFIKKAKGNTDFLQLAKQELRYIIDATIKAGISNCINIGLTALLNII